jgi:hypothetical protein
MKAKIGLSLDLEKDYAIAGDGILDSYFETGMECWGLILFKSGDEFKAKNLNYTANNKNGPEFYNKHEGIVFLDKGDILVLENGHYIGIGNISAAEEDHYSLSSYPYIDGNSWSKEEKSKWIDLFQNKTKAKLYRPKKKEDRFVFLALDPNYSKILRKKLNGPIF